MTFNTTYDIGEQVFIKCWRGKEPEYLQGEIARISVYKSKDAYNICWHISNLKIYDKPKELCEFATGSSTRTISEDGKLVWRGMNRPPQSWCYVEELQ